MKTTVLSLLAIILVWTTAVFAQVAVDNDLQPLVARDLDSAHGINRNSVVPRVSPDQTTDADISYESFPASGISTDVHTFKGDGANCKGSSQCKYCRASLDQILETLHKIPDHVTFGNNEKIACQVCNHIYFQGMCIFARNLHMKINAKDVREIVQRLRNHPCGRCGTVPIHEGASLDQGMITANYMNRACAGEGKDRARGCPKRQEVVDIPF
ncbi:hypothetical protein G6011_02437 [Alternaria panax]|uniref:Killer toxin Kp4 domain-containing protein n=1 Tax=Alternaria panax TaxID=48097 RepID=A0AAD4FDK2_9PLEO|nr:hypothetical protein G6011_02437 [Alternaria panax]